MNSECMNSELRIAVVNELAKSLNHAVLAIVATLALDVGPCIARRDHFKGNVGGKGRGSLREAAFTKTLPPHKAPIRAAPASLRQCKGDICGEAHPLRVGVYKTLRRNADLLDHEPVLDSTR